MRLLYVTPFFVPVIGGVETVVYETCSALTARGHDCFVLTSPLEGSPSRETIGGVAVNRMRSMTIPASGILRPEEFQWGDLGREFKELVEEIDPDVIHLHNFHMRQYAMYAMAFLGALGPSGPPTLMTIHNTTDDPFAHYFLSYLPLARVIALTNQSAMDLLKGGVPSTRVQVLPNMLDGAKFQRARGDGVRRELGLGDEPVVLFPSRVVGREGNAVYKDKDGKGLDVLLRAFPLVQREVPDAKLLLMGNDPIYPDKVRRVRREILDVARIFGMEESVAFFDQPIPQEKLPEIYAASDLVVSLGATECFGMVFLEGMAAGKPVVGVNSVHNGVPEVVWGGRAGLLVPPNNPWSVANAILQILGTPGKAEEMGQWGSRWVEAKYDTGVVLPNLLRLYGGSSQQVPDEVPPLAVQSTG